MDDKHCLYCMNLIKNSDRVCTHCGISKVSNRPHQLLPGMTLHNRFLVGRVLREDNAYITYIAFDNLLSLKVMIQEYYPKGLCSRNNAESAFVTPLEGHSQVFQNGIESSMYRGQTLAKFQGFAGVVNVRELFSENGTVYMVQDYFDSVTLIEYLQQNQRIMSQKLFASMMPVLTVLEELHNQEMLHMNISLNSILIGEDGKLKLSDIGTAKPIEPELHEGSWIDIRGICAVMYQCLTGMVPSGETLQRPSQLGVNISHNQEEMLMNVLTTQRNSYCQSISQLMDEIGSEKTLQGTATITGEHTQIGEKTLTTIRKGSKQTIAEQTLKTAVNVGGGDDKTIINAETPDKQTRKNYSAQIMIALACGLLIIVTLFLLKRPKDMPKLDTMETHQTEAITEDETNPSETEETLDSDSYVSDPDLAKTINYHSPVTGKDYEFEPFWIDDETWVYIINLLAFVEDGNSPFITHGADMYGNGSSICVFEFGYTIENCIGIITGATITSIGSDLSQYQWVFLVKSDYYYLAVSSFEYKDGVKVDLAGFFEEPTTVKGFTVMPKETLDADEGFDILMDGNTFLLFADEDALINCVKQIVG